MNFFRQAAALFLAFRVADLVNLAAGLYLVPKFVAPSDLGAVLPVSTFATTVSIPAFAFALVFMREGAILARRGDWGEWKSLVRGVFVATGAFILVGSLIAVFALPRYLRATRVTDTTVGSLVLAGAFLGSIAPVYSDALNALQRFRALGSVEVLSALARLAALAVLMPFRALAGYFAGNVIQPIARVLSSVFLLRRELSVPAKPYWTHPVARRLTILATGVTIYLATPLLASLAEQTVLRVSLGTEDSAAYYMLTRISGLLDYLTLPLLFVLFPHAAETRDKPTNAHGLIRNCQLATGVLALVLVLIVSFWGQTPLKFWAANPLAVIPNGARYAAYAKHLPLLIAIGALNAGQIFATNAAVAAGRLQFLVWHAPVNLLYALLLTVAPEIVSDLPALLAAMGVLAALRFGLSCHTTLRLRAPACGERPRRSQTESAAEESARHRE